MPRNVLILMLVLVAVFAQARSPAVAGPVSNDLGYEHLAEVMDKFHGALDVYTDVGAGGNHFVHRARMQHEDIEEEVVTLDDTSKEGPHSGITAIKNTFTPSLADPAFGPVIWGGWYFQNGVLLPGETQPSDNWGDVPNAGVDLTGATELTFWARGAEGGERVQFFAFGVGWDPDTGGPYDEDLFPYWDSSPKVTSCGLVPPYPPSEFCFDTLSDTWEKYTISLTGLDLTYVLGGFGWITHENATNGEDITFYLDDIRYDKARLDELRFLCSYETLPTNSKDFNPVMRNVAYTYDNSLALLAFLARGTDDDLQRARLLADAFVYALGHDRLFDDLVPRPGLLRNAYQCGDLISPPGWTPNGLVGTARMPGFWSAEDQQWFEDRGQVGSHTGNVLWPLIALLSYYEAQGGAEYLDAAVAMGQWIEQSCRDPKPGGGYSGGFEGWVPEQVTWQSTEHNIDAYVAFMKLYDATGDEAWLERAGHARDFVERMWTGEYFRTGTLGDGPDPNEPNEAVAPSDVNTWAALALASDITALPDWSTLLDWVEAHCSLSKDGNVGIDFDCDVDGDEEGEPDGEPDCIWWEGTAHLALAYRTAGSLDGWETYVDSLRQAQATGLNSNSKGIPAANCDGLTTGFDWEYFARLHVGATAWFLLAEQAYNPFCIAQQTPDADKDGLSDCREATLQTAPGVPDTDSDGCLDGSEVSGTPGLGGRRNPLNFWDFFDVHTGDPLARDGEITGLDIFGVIGRFNATDVGPGDFDRSSDPLSTPNPADISGTQAAHRQNYHPAYDRGAFIGPNAWNLGPPDGAIASGDIFGVIGQFGHSCL